MSRLKLTGIALGLSFSLLIAGCGNENEGKDTSETSENSLGEALDYTITGIEPGAGLTGLTKNTLEEYENLEGWELQESSTAGMIGALDTAIKKEEPIVITAWSPHWMFAAYDIKFIEDPKGTLGGAEDIQTIARIGLEQDMPEAYKIIDRFHWEVADVEAVMYAAQEVPVEEAAKNWVEQNIDKVNEWTEGVEKVNGEEIELVTTQWDTELAANAVLEEVLTKQGFKVTITPVDPAVMFQAIANGEGDASVAPWLPTTHGAFYEKHKDNIVDLGPNLTGTQNGFAVPTYMDIDSIEDLMPKK
ncbi:glycine betaine ABC transporter substrate-binding protein [Ureibacillus sp. NPDC094379]